MKEIVARALGWGFAGLLVGPAAVYSLMLLVLYRDPRCAPGGAGVCQLDIGVNLTLGAIFGFALFFAVAVIRGILRRHRGSD
jgi:hypothetical protein